MMHSHILFISEQLKNDPIDENRLTPVLRSALTEENYSTHFRYRPDLYCFKITRDANVLFAHSNYFVGIDWIIPEKAAIFVEPKLNDIQQIDFIGMLIESLETQENLEHLDGLFHIDYDKSWISIPIQKDFLSPILIVQFLKLTQKIVRKGLKKSYYTITGNLNNRIKGKVSVNHQIRVNILKNKLTKTICNYQEYGVNTTENQFLKLVLEFVTAYLNGGNQFFNKEQNVQLHGILNYCLSSFRDVETYKKPHERLSLKKNVFYQEYEDAVRIGEYILNRFSFNINKTSQNQSITPPFWIDMSKLFELYVFGKLRKAFPDLNAVTYHDSFLGGKETDILIRQNEYKCVIDCKYKPRYETQSPSLEDKRQLAGYTRMKSIYNKLGVSEDHIVKGIIVFSSQIFDDDIKRENLFKTTIDEYIQFYKLGVSLPVLKN